MSSDIEVLIADDHELIRKGLKQVIEIQTNYRVYEAEDGKEALDKLIKFSPRVAVLDIDMPYVTGVDIARKVKTEGIETDVIFLTMHGDEQLFNSAMNLGVKGFVLKENTVSEIVDCLESVISGNHYISPSMSSYLIKRASKQVVLESDKMNLNLLTATEHKVMFQLGQMKTNSEIADSLGVSIKTVQNHRNNICKKLDIRGRHALLKYAVEKKGQFES